MRKIIAVIFIFVFALCSCTKAKVQTYSQQPFCANVTAKNENEIFTASLVFSSPAQISLTVLTPQTIAGCIFEKNEDTITLTKGNSVIKIKSTENLTGEKNSFENLLCVLESIGQKEFNVSSEKSVLKGNYKFGEYTATADTKNGRLISVETPRISYTFTYN